VLKALCLLPEKTFHARVGGPVKRGAGGASGFGRVNQWWCDLIDLFWLHQFY
jgi:hypothetical protein